MGKKRDKLAEVSFACGCGHRFEAEPSRVEDVPEDERHPWEYFAECPECGDEARQAGWERGLLRAWANATGPRTAEGLARTAANLEGHPTPEEAKRTRFNAMKTGMRAEVAQFFPAKPGKYPHCEGCEYFDTCRPGDACQKRTELYMRHLIAFETSDPALLRQDHARLQATVRAIIDDIMLAILKTGVEVRTPEFWFDELGEVHIAEWEDSTGHHLIEKVNAHPLIKPLKDLIAANNLALGDAGMTEKVREDQDMLRGHLDGQGKDRESLLEHQRRQADALEGLRGMIENSRREVEKDPILLEHRREETT